MLHSTSTPTDHQSSGETNLVAMLSLEDISLDSQTAILQPGAEDYEPRQRKPQTEGKGGDDDDDDDDDDDPIGLKKQAIVLRDEFRSVASKLDEHTKNVNIARVGGGSLALAGGVTAIVGFALIPVTLGISALVAGITGAGIAAAGGLVAGGASVTKIFIDKFKLKPLIQKWSDFNGMLSRHLEERDPDTFRRMQDAMKAKVGQAAGVAAGAAGAVGAGAGAVRAGAVAAKVVGVEAAAAARVAAIAAAGSIALNAILIGISLYDIIDGSIDLYKQTGSKAGDYLRQLANSLDEFARKGLTQTFLESL